MISSLPPPITLAEAVKGGDEPLALTALLENRDNAAREAAMAWYLERLGVTVACHEFATFEGLPSDHYLKLVGAAGRMVRGEMPVTDELPALDSPKK